MRVIAGKARSLRLKTVEGDNTRPTTDRIKETLFNMIHGYIADCTFLDLFSGSGAIGIEALSRGAKSCVFVEKDRRALKCISDNLQTTGLKEQSEILAMDVISALNRLNGRAAFDCIFMDPPYNKDLEKQVLTVLADSQIANHDTLIIVEADKHTDFSYLPLLHMECIKKKEYKTNAHLFIQKTQE